MQNGIMGDNHHTCMGKLTVAGKCYDIKDGATIEQSVIENGLHPDSYLYLIDGKPVPMDTVIEGDMTVRAMKVASGG